MSQPVNIACLQTRAFGKASDALEHALELAAQAVASGAQLLVLPEYAGGLKTEGRFFAPPVYKEQEHPVLLGLRSFAKDNDVWIVLGSIAIEGTSDKFFNRTFVIDSAGNIQARYNKIHLFDIELNAKQSFKESEKVEPGNEAVVVDTPFGRLGLSICYDLRFANLYRDLAQAGAQILLVPAAFTKKTGEVHWHLLNRARAIENGAFVVAACAVGKVEGGGESYGHSLIIDPWGAVVAEGGTQTGVVQAVIDIEEVTTTRAKIPSLTHDKPYRLNVLSEQKESVA